MTGRAEGLDPGGGTFAPDGRYCATLRRRGTILAPPPGLDAGGEPLLPDGAVPFPRGIGFGPGGGDHREPVDDGDLLSAADAGAGWRVMNRLVKSSRWSQDLAIQRPSVSLVRRHSALWGAS